jgi:capsular exopolysaccharide synthesis family protein
MRNPSLHKLLDLDNREGLANLLAGEERTASMIRQSQWPNFDILTTGPMPPNPGELLNQGGLDTLLRELEKTYDHVIVDAPPVIGLVDAPSIATATEGTIFVIGANQTRTRSAIVSLRRLHSVQANIIGALLTKFRSAESGYGYNYDYHYSS